MALDLFIGAIAGGVIYDITKKIISKTYEYAKDNLKLQLKTKLKELLSGNTYVGKSLSDNERDKVTKELIVFLEKTKQEDLESRNTFIKYLKSKEQELVNILNRYESNESLHQKTEGDNSPIFNNVQGSISNNVIGDNSGNTIYNNNGDVYNGVDPEKK